MSVTDYNNVQKQTEEPLTLFVFGSRKGEHSSNRIAATFSKKPSLEVALLSPCIFVRPELWIRAMPIQFNTASRTSPDAFFDVYEVNSCSCKVVLVKTTLSMSFNASKSCFWLVRRELRTALKAASTFAWVNDDGVEK